MENIKFIVDVNVEKAVVNYLLERGYDTIWVADYNRKMTDEDLLNLANIEKRIIITNEILSRFIVITKDEIRFIPMENIK